LIFPFFSDDKDRDNFVDRLGEIVSDTQTFWFGRALIPKNHLLVRTRRANLKKKTMHWFGTTCTQFTL
jgi:hypothetical protein